jgi:hypothetical protein
MLLQQQLRGLLASIARLEHASNALGHGAIRSFPDALILQPIEPAVDAFEAVGL